MTTPTPSRVFVNWNGEISLSALHLALTRSLGSGNKELDLQTRQDLRDIVEFMLFDDITYHDDIKAYIPQQTQANPVHLA